jgi:hypothetical protein
VPQEFALPIDPQNPSMTFNSSYLLPSGVALAIGVVLLAAWLRSRGRQPCPHCGRKKARAVLEIETGPTGVGPRSIVYECRGCGGAMRYARRPTGEEFWEAVEESSFTPHSSSFPRSAWECSPAAPRPLPAGTVEEDAERPQRHSHAERGNEEDRGQA